MLVPGFRARVGPWRFGELSQHSDSSSLCWCRACGAVAFRHPTSSKEYWLRELYLGLKVTASFDRSESYTRVIDGQVRCITPDFKPKDLQVAWNVQFITVFVPAWMVPPIYHSLRRECIKNMNSASAIGVKSVRPTWFEDTATPMQGTWGAFAVQ